MLNILGSDSKQGIYFNAFIHVILNNYPFIEKLSLLVLR